MNSFLSDLCLLTRRYDMCRRRKGGRCTKGTAGKRKINPRKSKKKTLLTLAKLLLWEYINKSFS